MSNLPILSLVTFLPLIGALAILIIKGKHEPNNLVAFQYLCVDLSENFFEMKDKKIKNVHINLQITEASNEQILPLIQAIADSYDIVYTKN